VVLWEKVAHRRTGERRWSGSLAKPAFSMRLKACEHEGPRPNRKEKAIDSTTPQKHTAVYVYAIKLDPLGILQTNSSRV